MADAAGGHVPDWTYTKERRPPEAGLYRVLAQLDDGTLVEQVDRWNTNHHGGWWGPARCGDVLPGSVIAWKELDE